MAPLHDRVRNVPGSFERALATLRRARDLGLAISVNTQIGAQTMPTCQLSWETIIDVGAKQWQVQLTVAMGNAVDNDGLLLQPHRLIELMPLLAKALPGRGRSRSADGRRQQHRLFRPVRAHLAGFGDEHIHWTGCHAGHTVLALKRTAPSKAVPPWRRSTSAAATSATLALADIWRDNDAIRFGRLRTVDDLWGFCRTCYYADVCRGGCTWTAHSLLGTPGNNPYCHYRALELEKRGLRDRIVKIRDAAAASFAIGGVRARDGAHRRRHDRADKPRLAASAQGPQPGRARWGRAACRPRSVSAAPATPTSSAKRRPARTAAPTCRSPPPSTRRRAAAEPPSWPRSSEASPRSGLPTRGRRGAPVGLAPYAARRIPLRGLLTWLLCPCAGVGASS